MEDPTDSNDDEPKPRTRQSVMDFKADIAEIRARIRRRAPRFPDNLNLPPPHLPRQSDDDPGDGPPSLLPISSTPPENNDESMFEQTPSGDRSNGEDGNANGNENPNLVDLEDSQPNGVDGNLLNGNLLPNDGNVNGNENPKLVDLEDSLPNGEDGNLLNGNLLPNGEDQDCEIQGFSRHYDKYEAAVSIQPRPILSTNEKGQRKDVRNRFKNGEHMPVIPDSETTLADMRRVVVQRQIHFMNTSSGVDKETPQELVYGTRPLDNLDDQSNSLSKVRLQELARKGIRKALITVKTVRRILNFKESIMKYGVFIPRNDSEADASPEHLRWDSGRMLE